MAKTKLKGDIGQSMIMADILRRGYKLAVPFGEDWDYDLIVLRNGIFQRIQCKYTESKNGVVMVYCRSCNGWSLKKYSSETIDWMACYDAITSTCYYIPAHLLGGGMSMLTLRLDAPKNNATKNIRFANDYLAF